MSEALRRELLREGQAFYVHNRVSDIDRVARDVRDLVPEARVAIAHGQMDEGSLETVVLDFWERRYDVLVCTTIIESGIDMPSVNTLIVDRADLLGLGQLHQIRGRVGRGGQRAYAYLFHPADRVLSEQAYERLRTIGEHTELGSGFKIAMRDLEIRGAGNLLGSDQSGHIAAVGYDLYVQLVAEAVAEAQGRAQARRRRPSPSTSPGTRTSRRTTWRPRTPGSRRTAGWRRRPPRPTWTTSAWSGPTATARCRPPPQGLLALGAAAGQRHGAPDRRDRHELGPPRRHAPTRGAGVAGRAAGQCPGAAAAPGAGRDLPRGPGPAPGAHRRGASRPPTPCATVIEDLIPLADAGVRTGTPCSMRGA